MKQANAKANGGFGSFHLSPFLTEGIIRSHLRMFINHAGGSRLPRCWHTEDDGGGGGGAQKDKVPGGHPY